MRRVADFVLNRSRLVIGLFVVLTLLMALSASRTVTDNRTEALYPDDSRIDGLTRDLEATFNQHQRLLVVVEHELGDIFTPVALEAVRALDTALRQLPAVVEVTSVATASRMEDDDGFLIVEDLMPRGSIAEADAAEIREYLATSPMYEHVTLVTHDGRYASLIVELREGLDAAAVAKSVDSLLASSWPGDYSLAGQAFTSMELQNIIGRDLPILGGIAIALILLMLFLNFRTVQGTFLPLVQILVGVVWGMGLFQLLGHKLMALTVIGPIAVMAVGSSFALHLLGRYYFELSRGSDKYTAISHMLTETGLGVTLSGLAIAAAMSTFLLSDLAMVRGLGLLAALGVLAALLASMLLLPALLNMLPTPRRIADPDDPGAIGTLLGRLARFVTARRKAVLTVAVLLVIIGVAGTTRIVSNTSILAFFPESGPTRTSVETVEQVLGGSANLTVWLEGDLTDPDLLAAMLRFQEQASELEGMGPGQSIANVLHALNLTLTGEDALPASSAAIAQELLLFQSSGGLADLTRFVTLDYHQAIISFVAESMSTGRAGELEAEIGELAEANFGELATVRLTGQPLLEREIEEAMRHDFVISLTLAIALVILIDSFVRSFRAAAVTILALLATVALQYGILGWFGIPLNLATMLMGALAIGVGDYAIHLTVRYMEERRNGLDPEAAMSHTLMTSGRQILFTAITLGAGFSALAFARFVPVATLGGLMLLTVALVGIATLTLLPAASLTVFRNPHSRFQGTSEVSQHA